MGKKVADQLVETICRAGIRHIYAVTVSYTHLTLPTTSRV